MNLDGTVSSVYYTKSGGMVYIFKMVYDYEGNLIHVINPYDNGIIYSESQSAQEKRDIREVDERSS